MTAGATRVVQIPAPASACLVSFERWSDDCTPALEQIILAAVAHDEQERSGGWAVLWLPYRAGCLPPDLLDAVAIAVTGDDGGQSLARLLVAGLRSVGGDPLEGLGVSLRRPDWGALAARWGVWTAGPCLGAIRADLEVQDGVMAPRPLPALPLPEVRCPSPTCRHIAPPLPLFAGYPDPHGEVALSVAMGEAGLSGCLVGSPSSTAQCRSCGSAFVPGDTEASEAVAALAGTPPTRQPAPMRSLWSVADPRLTVWSPAAALLADHWWLVLAPGVRASLERAPRSWVALRLQGAAVVYAPSHSFRIHEILRRMGANVA